MFRAFLALLLNVAAFAQSSDITELLQKQVLANHLAGIAVIVVRADSVIAVAAAGVRHDGQSTPIGSSDIFHLGSNTKAITATMVARLIQAGKLKWSTTPADVFPELNDADPALKRITLEQLLSHYAGLPPYEDTSDKEFKTLPKFTGNATEQRSQFTNWVLRHPPAVPPGTKPLYSNAGYAVAAAMAERVTGSTWEQLVTNEVLDPIGIHAAFAWPLAVGADEPWGHTENKKGVKPVDQSAKDSELPAYLLPAGGMAMTIADYGKFLQANLQALRSKDALFTHLHTAPMRDKYALGWGAQSIDGVPSSAHTGSAGSFYAVAAIQSAQNVGVAVLLNSDGSRSAATAAKVLKALLKQFAVQ